jgi:protein-S-isoprenylcysteine O-methyltransferase Ste14
VSFLATFLYLAGWLSNMVVPRSIDHFDQYPWMQSLLVNTLLIALFGVQHSVMARPTFKRWWTRFVPKPIERSTYVLCTNLAFVVLFWQWRPMDHVIWDVQHAAGRASLHGLCVAGWLTVLVTTCLINHFDLFGLRQVWLYFRGRTYTPLAFVTPGPYRFVRHPLYVGWLTAFWATPTMTVGHLLFACGSTAYILTAIWFEERNLLEFHGDRYAWYRNRTPMLVPFTNHVRVGSQTSMEPGQEEPAAGTWKHTISLFFALGLFGTVSAAGCTGVDRLSCGHGWCEQQSPLDGGKLLSFKTTETTSTGTSQDCLCHVLLVYPTKANDSRVFAGGGGTSGGDFPRFRVRWTFRTNDVVKTKRVELRYDLAAGKLHVEGHTMEPQPHADDESAVVLNVVERSVPGEQPFSLEDANLFVVDLDSDYDIADIHRIGKRITETVTISDFRRLLPGHPGVQRVSEPAPAVATSEARYEAAAAASTSW